MAYRGIPYKMVNCVPQRPRQHHIVGVEKGNVFARGVPDSSIAGCSQPTVARRFAKISDLSRYVSMNNVRRGVCRCVINNHDLN